MKPEFGHYLVMLVPDGRLVMLHVTLPNGPRLHHLNSYLDHLTLMWCALLMSFQSGGA